MPRWGMAKLVAKPAAPASIASRSTRCISAISSGVAVRSYGVVAHHVEPQRGVADVRGEVDADAVRRRPRPRYSGKLAKSHGMPAASAATSMSSTFSSVRAMSSWCSARGRRDREPAVAGDDGGDAVEARRRERGVPEHLRVVVRVDVDEAGGDDAVAGVEDAIAVEVRTDLGDAATGDGDVGPHARGARAVVHGPALDHRLVRHRGSPDNCAWEPA